MISYPRQIKAGQVNDEVVTAMDIMPTVLALCGVDPPVSVQWDGASLLPILQDNAASHNKVMHWQWFDRWAVRQGDWKLIHPRGGKMELVNLADEKPEAMNYLDAEPARAAQLKALHDAWVAEVMPSE